MSPISCSARPDSVHSGVVPGARLAHAIRRGFRAGLLARDAEFHAQLRPALGSQHALVRHAEQDPDDRARRAVHRVSGRAERLAGARRSRTARRRPDPFDARARPRGRTSRRGSASPGRPMRPAAFSANSSADPARPASAPRPESTTRPFRTRASSSKSPTLRTACSGSAQSPVLFDQPFLTRADGSSQTQRFPFILPVPGSPAIKNLDWSVFLPITSSPGYQPGNKLPYGEHFNFSIQRQLSSSTVLTLAYVGTEGHKLFAQYEANPGDAALCLSLRGTGVAAGNAAVRTQPGELRFTRPDGTRCSERAVRWASISAATPTNPPTPTPSYNSAAGDGGAARARISRSWPRTRSASRMDNASGFSTMNFSNFRLSRALSSFDATHNFVFSYNYALPFDRAFAGAPKRLTQGWSAQRHHAVRDRLPDRASRRAATVRSPAPAASTTRIIVGGLVITQRRSQHAEPPVLQQERLHIRSAGDDGQRQPALLPRTRD